MDEMDEDPQRLERPLKCMRIELILLAVFSRSWVLYLGKRCTPQIFRGQEAVEHGDIFYHAHK